MTVYVNSRNEIKSVGVASDSTLTPIEITDGTFDGWSDGKICCYKINVVDGHVTMFTPYVDSRMIDHFDGVSRQTEDVQTTVSGAYDSSKAYEKDEYCMWNNNLYRFTQDYAKGVTPDNTTYWTLCDIATELNRLNTIIKEK